MRMDERTGRRIFPALLFLAFALQCSRGYPDSDFLNNLMILDSSISGGGNQTVIVAAGTSITPGGIFTSEAGAADTFTVVLDRAPAANVIFSVTSSAPTVGVVAPSSLTFTSGNWDTTQTVTVTGQDDVPPAAGNTPYSITIGAAVSSDPDYNNLGPYSVSALNLDNEVALGIPGVLILPSTGLTTTEGGGTANFSVVLQSQPAADVSFNLTSSLPAEGGVAPGSLTFTFGNWDTPQSVTVTGQDDSNADGDIPYQITTSTATSLDTDYDGLDPVDVDLTNLDDDTPGITVTVGANPLVISEPATANNFTVVLDSIPSALVKICLSESDTSEGSISTIVGDALGADGDCPTARLEFNAGNWNISQTVSVDAVDDPNSDGAQNHTVILSPAISTDLGYSGIDPDDVAFTTTDDDGAAGITVTGGALAGITEAGGLDTFSVVLDTQPTADVTVNILSSDTGEASVAPGSLVFTAGPCPATGNWCTAQLATVTGVDDFLVDGAQPFTILVTASSLDPVYNAIDPADPTGSTVDNDTAGVTVSPVAGLITDERGKKDTFTVVLDTQPSADVTVTADATAFPAEIRVSNNDFTYAGTAALTFTATNWFLGQTIYVQGLDDAVLDPAQPFTISLAAVSGDSAYNGIAIPSATGTNENLKYRVFATALTYDGDLMNTAPAGANGPDGADQKCMADPYYPGIGSYKALIVDDVNRRACSSDNCSVGGVTEHIDWVLKPNSTYVRLLDMAPIMNTDANGVFVFGNLTNAWDLRSVAMWTGICGPGGGCPGWAADAAPADWTCNGWTSNLPNPPSTFNGDGTTSSDISQMYGGSGTCDASFYLLCVEQ